LPHIGNDVATEATAICWNTS